MKQTIRLLLLALVYALAGKLGLRLAFVNASVTAVWPPAGIALAACLIYGYRIWPGIFLGAFVLNAATAGTVLTSLSIAAGNTLEGLLGAYLVNRFAHGRTFYDHPHDIFKFALAAFMSPIVSATIGVFTLLAAGYASLVDVGTLMFTWWMGDAGGILVVAPFLILWSGKMKLDTRERDRIAEAAAVSCALVLLGLFVFGGLFPGEASNYPLEYLCIPVVVWTAFRLGSRETATATVVLSVMAVWGTLNRHGPFSRASSPNDSLQLLQAYMGVVSVMGLAVAAVVSERQRALRTSEARFDRLLKSNIIGILTVEADGLISDANDAFLNMIGYTPDMMAGVSLNIHTLIAKEYQAQQAWVLEQLRVRGQCPALEGELVRRDGSQLPVLVGGIRLDRSPDRSIYFVIDASLRRKAMQALRQAYDEMESRVEGRTRELSELSWELSKEVALRKEAEAELREQSLKDPLTGLYNRRGFLALAEQQWLMALRDKRPFLVFFADVDALKPINDTLGHQKGDQALVEAAFVLRETFRKSDILARVGGDEFAIVASAGPIDQIREYLNRLQDQLDKINASGRLPFNLSLTVGVSQFDHDEKTSVSELLRKADQDLYAKKHLRPRLT